MTVLTVGLRIAYWYHWEKSKDLVIMCQVPGISNIFCIPCCFCSALYKKIIGDFLAKQKHNVQKRYGKFLDRHFLSVKMILFGIVDVATLDVMSHGSQNMTKAALSLLYMVSFGWLMTIARVELLELVKCCLNGHKQIILCHKFTT